MYRLKLSIALTLLTVTQAYSASYTKWTDAEGNTHYGDKIPVAYSKSAEIINVHPDQAHTNATDSLQNKIKRLDETNIKRKEAREKEAMEKAKKDALSKNCQQSKKQLKLLNEHSRIRMKQKNGDYRMLSVEEKRGKVREIKESISKYCNPS